MSNYTIISNQGGYSIMDKETGLFFNGYDFMGSVDWSEEETIMEIDEASQIVKDLEDDDEPDDGLTDDDRRIKSSHPDWLCFPGIYHSEEATSACFFDLESLLADMKRYLGYDNEHCEIVRKAMMAYAKQN